jgi:hypothetical protein
MRDEIVCTCTATNRHVSRPHLVQELAVLRGVHWPLGYTLRFGFLGGSTEAQDRIMAHASNWSKYADIDFRAVAGRTVGVDCDVLVGFSAAGFWSMLGTGSYQVRDGSQTMNLEDFDNPSYYPESEYLRVVQHEVGHALGCLHEQQRPEVVALLDPAGVIAEFERTQGWSEEEIRQQILSPFDPGTVDETAQADLSSVMQYSFSAACTRDHRPIAGGADITDLDKLQISRIYPGRYSPTGPPPAPPPPAPPPGPPIPANPGLVEVPLGGKAALGHTGLLKPAEFWLAVPSSRTVRFDASVQGTAWMHLPPTLDIVAAGATGGLRVPFSGGPAIWSGQAPLAAGGYTLRLSSPNPLHAAVAYLKAT